MRVRLIIPEPEPGTRNPGGIEPGYYNLVELVEQGLIVMRQTGQDFVCRLTEKGEAESGGPLENG